MSAAGARYGLIAGVTLTVDVPLCVAEGNAGAEPDGGN